MSDIQGLQQFQQKLNDIKGSIHGRGGASLYKFAVRIKNEAVRRAPKETGALRASGRVEGPMTIGGETVVKVIFGNEVAYYAIYVHEDLSAKHTNGEAKYLENAINAIAPQMADFIQSEFWQNWQG